MTRRRNSPSSAMGDALADPKKPLAVESMAEVSGDLGFFCCGEGRAVEPTSRMRMRVGAIRIGASKNLGRFLAHPCLIVHGGWTEVPIISVNVRHLTKGWP